MASRIRYIQSGGKLLLHLANLPVKNKPKKLEPEKNTSIGGLWDHTFCLKKAIFETAMA